MTRRYQSRAGTQGSLFTSYQMKERGENGHAVYANLDQRKMGKKGMGDLVCASNRKSKRVPEQG